MHPRNPKSYKRKILLVLLVALAFLALLVPRPALAQEPPAEARLIDILFDDADGSGGASCGDIINYLAGVGASGTDPVTLTGVRLTLPIDPASTIVPGTLVAGSSQPGTAPRILSGTRAGDSQVVVEWDEVCVNGCVRSGAPVSFRVQINDPTAADHLSVWGTLEGSNFSTRRTLNERTGQIEPVVTDFAPCPPPLQGPFVSALKSDSLLVDHDGDGLVDEGDTVRYTTVLRNSPTADLGALDVRFRSGVDPASRLVAGSVTTSAGSVVTGNAPGDGSVDVAVGLLGPGASATVTFDVVVDDPVPATVSRLLCQGHVTGGNFTEVLTDDPATPAVGDPTATPLDFDPDLALTKTDGGATAVPGQLVRYTLRYENRSARSPSGGAFLGEVVPAHSAFAPGASAAGWECQPDSAGSGGGSPGTTCILDLGTVGPGASGSRVFSVRVADPLPAGVTELTNVAVVSDDGSQGPDRDLTNNQAQETTPVASSAGVGPDLAIEKSDGGATTEPGGGVLYTLTIRNLGNRGATGVEVTDTVPQGTRFDPAGSSAGWSCSPDGTAGSRCALGLGSLAGGGATRAAGIAFTVDPTLPAGTVALTNTAEVTDDGTNGADLELSNNRATDTTPLTGNTPALEVDKTLDPASEGRPGGLLLFRLAYRNTGTQGASGVELRETVPAATTFEPGSSTAGWQCTPGPGAGSACVLAVGDLPAGGSGEARFAVRLDDPLPAGIEAVENCAEIADAASSGGAAMPGMTQACATAPVPDARPDLAVEKDDGGVTAAPGDTVVYTLTFRNHGNQGATGVTLRETVPLHASFLAGPSAPGWQCQPDGSAGSGCTLDLGTVAAGEAGSVPFAVRVDDPLPVGVDQVDNVVTIDDDGTNGADLDPSDNRATDSTPIVAPPPPPPPPPPGPDGTALEVDLDDELTLDVGGDGHASAGDTLTYATTITNVGTVAASSVSFDVAPDVHTHLLPGSVALQGGQVVQGNGPHDTQIEVQLGGLRPGESTQVLFSVQLADPLPDGLRELVVQGHARADNAPEEPSNDPETAVDDDPTRTPLLPAAGPAPNPKEVPTLSEWALLLLALLLGSASLRLLRGRGGEGREVAP